MPDLTSFLGIIFGLSSAIVWGTGDFAGGYASRKQSQYQVLFLSALSGLVLMVLTALVFREPLPSTRSIIFAALGGLSGALGIAVFYRSLAIGNAAVVAPTTAVIGTALPVLFSTILEGLPSHFKLAGFILAVLGIWLVSAGESDHPAGKNGFSLAVLAGIGFAGWLILLGNVEKGSVFTPLVISRLVALCTGITLVLINRQPFPGVFSSIPALVCGVLDVGGNIFYVLARQFTRLDVAAVLSSLGPAITVIITTIVLKEPVSRRQWIGVVTCLAAVGLITI
jgi:drug/metabolite transporter (DMT)-like permease